MFIIFELFFNLGCVYFLIYFTGNPKALSQPYQAWCMVKTLENLRVEINENRLDLLTGLEQSGYLISLAPNPIIDHSYLQYLRHSSPTNLLALRGINWLPTDPTQSSSQVLISNKQKPGRKVCNFGSRTNKVSKRQTKGTIEFLHEKKENEWILDPENIDFHFGILRDIARVAIEKIEKDLAGIIPPTIEERSERMYS